MRLKLVLICSSIAAIVGAGAAAAIILSVFSSLTPVTRPGLVVVLTYLLPLTAILLASIFVYRHTARRRKLQAILTATLSILLTILIFIIASIVTARRAPINPETPRDVSKAFRKTGSAKLGAQTSLSAMSA
jgi:hypothetical protein